MNMLRFGVVGGGGIGLASAAWAAHRGHPTSVWSPRGSAAASLQQAPLTATGALDTVVRIEAAPSAAALAAFADVLLIAVPANGHRAVMDALLPHLRNGQLVLVSAMSSLSSLYLYEAACRRGLAIDVASFGTTALTARRKGPTHVDVMTRRAFVGVACLPRSGVDRAVKACTTLFGEGFSADSNPLVSTLANTNAIAHAPLAIFNWTRIERAEAWPQYHFMTPHVAAAIERLDEERRAVAEAFGLTLPSIEQHFSRSFNTDAQTLAEIAAELHRKRGGPPGPTDVHTRFLSEDIPYGLVFIVALARMVGVPTPATDAAIASAELIVGKNFTVENDLIAALGLVDETVQGLLERVNRADAFSLA